MSERYMANRKMTLSKTKLSQLVSSSISGKARNLGFAAALLLSSSNASALGLGSLEIASNLDQPLSGTIQLRVSPGDDLNSLTAVIASREDFESLGIEYPEYLENFSLLLDTLGDERLLRVTSNNVVIKEPFIHFLVRVQWSGGSFLREYTALIDPPVYAAEAPASVAEPREVGTDQTYQADTVDTSDVDEQAYDEVVAQDLPEPVIDEEVAAEEPLIEDNFYDDEVGAVSDEPSVDSSDGLQAKDASYGPVERGETLSAIAADLQSQFPDLSIYQIMKVMFDENQSSFIDANINGLIQGSILSIGDLNAIGSVDIAESRAFYSQQIAEWDPQSLQPSGSDSINVGQDNYNFQDDLSFASDESESDSFGAEDSFQVGSSTESNDYVSSDQGDSRDGEVLALRQEVATLQSSLASSELEKQELNERISLLEGQLADLNRLAELSVESADLATIEQTLAEQNDSLDEFTSEGSEIIEEFADSADEDSAIDEFLSSGDEAIDEVADQADAALDDLVDDADASLDEFLSDDLGTTEDVSLLDSESDPVGSDSGGSDLESVIEEAASDESVVTSVPAATITTPQEKSFLDKAMSSFFEGGLWKVVAGIGALLVAGVGLIFMRRRRADEEFEISMLSIESNSHSVGHSASTEDSASMSASHTASIASEAVNADKETSFLTVYSDSDAVVQADEVDPVAEADVYIAYGRDEQAEEVLLDGVVSHPDRIDIKQKLLSLYHKRQNAEGFERIAEELYSQRAALTGDVWQQVCEMGKEVAPSNPLFELSGDDLNTAIETDSELLLQGEDISEVPIEAESANEDDAGLEFAATTPSDEAVDHLDDAEKHSDLDESLTLDDESEMVVGSLSDDESIQLVNFDDGRSEISELNDVEIDAIEFGDGIPDALNLSNDTDDKAEATSNDEDEALDFNIEEAAASNDDLEKDLGEVQEVSDLEIDPDYDEARTQYELAKVFVDLGDEDGARKILVELVDNEENSADVLSDAKELLESINS